MSTATRTRPVGVTPAASTARDWLAAEFPEWDIDVDVTAGWNGESRPLYVARRDGHHPQAELSPGRLHTRLEEYLRRSAARQPRTN